MTTPQFDLVVACDQRLGIGLKSGLPWKLKEDLKYFRKLTSDSKDPFKQNVVIMGRKTWDSLPEQYRPLKDRMNFVITSTPSRECPGAITCTSLDDALDLISQLVFEDVFVIGGGQIYSLAVAHPNCRKIYITRIERDFHCDTFFPAFEERFHLVSKSDDVVEDNLAYRFEVYERNYLK